MPKRSRDAEPQPEPKRRPGRPRGSTSGGLERRIVVRCSEEYRVWLEKLSEHTGVSSESELVRLAFRALSAAEGFRNPPEK